MKTPNEVACYLAKSHLTRLVNVLGSDDFQREKLAAYTALGGAARFAALLDNFDAARILDDASDGLLSLAMCGPNTASHLARMIAKVERSEVQG